MHAQKSRPRHHKNRLSVKEYEKPQELAIVKTGSSHAKRIFRVRSIWNIQVTNTTQAVFWKFVSTTCFALISFIVCFMFRHGTPLSIPQLAFFQMLLPFVALVGWRQYQGSALRITDFLTTTPRWAVLRSLGACAAFLAWFQAIQIFPLTFLTGFRIAGPLFTFAAALVFLKERTTPWRLVGLVFLLAGPVWMLFQNNCPKDIDNFWAYAHIHHLGPTLLPFVVIIGYTLANISGKKLLQYTQPLGATRSLLGMNTLILGFFAFFYWQPISLAEMPWIMALGALELFAQLSLCKALYKTQLNLLAPLSLWRFSFTAILSALFLKEYPSTLLMLSTGLMLVGTPLILYKQKR